MPDLREKYTREQVKGWVKTYPTLTEAGKELGFSRERIRQLVTKYKVGRRISVEGYIIVFYGHLLGTKCDREMAEIAGVSRYSACSLRTKLGIPLKSQVEVMEEKVRALASRGFSDPEIAHHAAHRRASDVILQ